MQVCAHRKGRKKEMSKEENKRGYEEEKRKKGNKEGEK